MSRSLRADRLPRFRHTRADGFANGLAVKVVPLRCKTHTLTQCCRSHRCCEVYRQRSLLPGESLMANAKESPPLLKAGWLQPILPTGAVLHDGPL